jgi:hypothetical protein
MSTFIDPYRISTPIGYFVSLSLTKSAQSGFDSSRKPRLWLTHLTCSLCSLREMEESNPQPSFWRGMLYHLTNLPWSDKYSIQNIKNKIKTEETPF